MSPPSTDGCPLETEAATMKIMEANTNTNDKYKSDGGSSVTRPTRMSPHGGARFNISDVFFSVLDC